MNKMLFVHSRSLGYTFDFFNDANAGVLPRQSAHKTAKQATHSTSTTATSTSTSTSTVTAQDSTIGGVTTPNNAMPFPNLIEGDNHDNADNAATTSTVLLHDNRATDKKAAKSSKVRRSTTTSAKTL